MPTFEIVPARPWHCGQIVRNLREADRQSCLRLGFYMHTELRHAFDNTVWPRAWLIDGELAGLGGVTGPVIAPSGFVWLALSQPATRYKVALVRTAREQLAQLSLTKTDLVTSILPGDQQALRFASFLGFDPIWQNPVIPCGAGEAFLMCYNRRAA